MRSGDKALSIAASALLDRVHFRHFDEPFSAEVLRASLPAVMSGRLSREPCAAEHIARRAFQRPLRPLEDDHVVCFASGFENAGDHRDHEHRPDGLRIFRFFCAEISWKEFRQPLRAIPRRLLR